MDFLRGAARSKGGLPIIALPSTAKEGAVSRIVPTLRPGAGVVTSRGDVHYVITEHGVAYLHGKTHAPARRGADCRSPTRSSSRELEEYARAKQAADAEPLDGFRLNKKLIGRDERGKQDKQKAAILLGPVTLGLRARDAPSRRRSEAGISAWARAPGNRPFYPRLSAFIGG